MSQNLRNWAAEVLICGGILAWGGAAYKMGGEVALLAFVGAVFIIASLAMAWKQGRES